jgi:hypothetical protein
MRFVVAAHDYVASGSGSTPLYARSAGQTGGLGDALALVSGRPSPIGDAASQPEHVRFRRGAAVPLGPLSRSPIVPARPGLNPRRAAGLARAGPRGRDDRVQPAQVEERNPRQVEQQLRCDLKLAPQCLLQQRRRLSYDPTPRNPGLRGQDANRERRFRVTLRD